jgi:glutathione S-transferase
LADTRAALARMERAVGSPGKFLVGGAPTIADAALGVAMWLLQDLVEDYGRALPRRPFASLSSWYARLRAEPRAAAVFAEGDA